MMYLKSMTLPARADILVVTQEDIAGNKPRSGGILRAQNLTAMRFEPNHNPRSTKISTLAGFYNPFWFEYIP
jgi:hypothetical protein